jgi:hypothetical protein
MIDFKFFQKPTTFQQPGNMYLMFNMDDALINVIRWKQYFNIDMINSDDTELSIVNVPIVNCWMRILNWRYHQTTLTSGNYIVINYRVIELNNQGRDFTFLMNETEFLRRIDITGL